MNKCLGFLLFILPLANADILSVHCPKGCPTNPENNNLVFSHVYALSNNPSTKFADWVAYEVNVLNFGASPGRNWKADPLLDDDETLEPEDYKDANSSALQSDRGHQAPLASFAGSHYWPELNYLSNITPQNKKLNQGVWKDLEDAVRNAVEFRQSLFVITGPFYEGTPVTLPRANEAHRVPTGYFKIIYNTKGEAASFLMKQNDNTTQEFCTKSQTLVKIQEKVRFELPALIQSESMFKKLGCD